MIWLLACNSNSLVLGDFLVEVDNGLRITQGETELLQLSDFAIGKGESDIEFKSGSYLFDSAATQWAGTQVVVRAHNPPGVVGLSLEDDQGESVARIDLSLLAEDVLSLQISAVNSGENRLRAGFHCTPEPILGTGAHAWDVDHYGEAYPLWVSEPGIGKAEDDMPPDDWFVTGTRHASSFPQPFLLLPERSLGIAIASDARIELDLCKTDPDLASMVVWDDHANFVLFAKQSPLEVVQAHALFWGEPAVPPDWALGGAWNDAIRGVERVRAVAEKLRTSGASSSAIWTEDWKGGEDYSFGYHLSAEWEVDPEKYPDAALLAGELADQGFAWLAYFSPFIAQDSVAAVEAEPFLIRTEAGDPYWFPGITFKPTSVLDLSRSDAREWARGKMQAAVDLGFDGWMADFAEWLPPDAVLAGADALDQHNAYPLWWQETNRELTEGLDTVVFSRSGWNGTATLSPVTWAGDQRTTFDPDDGLPTVLPMGLGLGIGGVPFFAHDIGGYSSLGNDPSTKELWFRWCTLGAFSPIMRTHHGAFDTSNWAFDSDEETLALFARYSREHARLFPYLHGLSEQARKKGTPLLLHPALLYPSASWQAIDAWMLGAQLYVAPVLEAGKTERNVDLPTETTWYDWWTGDVATGGTVSVPLDSIAVYVPAASIVPTFTTAPDTFLTGANVDLVDADEADLDRTLRVFGSGGRFTEADGTTYVVEGKLGAAGTAEATLKAGEIEVNGLTVRITGTRERLYRVQAYP